MKKNRSMLGVLAAVLLALVGGLLLWQSSDDGESEAIEEPVDQVQVLVAARQIEPGTAASQMADNAFAFVVTQSIPADQKLQDALVSIDNLDELKLARNVTARVIPEGVQLRVSDFVIPGQQDTSALPDVDENVFEVTVALEPQRALGGNIRGGQTLAVIASFESGVEEQQNTVVILESATVTNVQAEQLFTENQLSSDPLAPSLAPTSRLFVTFGVEVADLEKLTFATEFGRIWLARQGDAAVIEGSDVQTLETVIVSLDPEAPSNEGKEDEETEEGDAGES